MALAVDSERLLSRGHSQDCVSHMGFWGHMEVLKCSHLDKVKLPNDTNIFLSPLTQVHVVKVMRKMCLFWISVMDSVFEEVISRASEEMSRLCSTREEEQDLHEIFLDILQRQKPQPQGTGRSEDTGGHTAFWRALRWGRLKPCALCEQQTNYSFPSPQQLNKNLGYRWGGSVTALINVSLGNAGDEMNGSLRNMVIIPGWVGQPMRKDCCAHEPES